MLTREVLIEVRDGSLYLVICGLVIKTTDGEVVIPEDSPDLRVPLQPEHLIRLASQLAQLGYVRI